MNSLESVSLLLAFKDLLKEALGETLENRSSSFAQFIYDIKDIQSEKVSNHKVMIEIHGHDIKIFCRLNVHRVGLEGCAAL